MHRKRRWIVLMFVVFLLANLHSKALALINLLDHPHNSLSLQGLEELCGGVVDIHYWARSIPDSVTPEFEEELAKHVGMRLQKAGIRVLPPGCNKCRFRARTNLLKTPFFYISVNIKNIHSDQYYSDFELCIYQKVYLERTRAVGPFLAITYRKVLLDRPVGPVPKDEIKNIRNFVKQLVDGFIEDYRAVNSK